MPMHVAHPSSRPAWSTAADQAWGSSSRFAGAAGGVGPVARATEAAATRGAVSSAVARSIELSIGRRQEGQVYDSRGRLDAPTPRVPQQEPVAAADTEAWLFDAQAEGEADVVAEAEAEVEAEAEGATESGPADGAEAARGRSGAAFVASGGPVTIEILASDSGYDNQIVVSFDGFKSYQTIGIDDRSAGQSIVFEVPEGTALDFGIVNGEGTLLRAGDAGFNPDGLEHAQSMLQGDGALTIGFEDLVGGGDMDFNDAIIRVTNVRQGEPVAQAEATAAAGPPAEADADVTAEADAALDAEAEAEVAQAADEAEALASSELQNSQLAAVAERNRQLLAALYLPEPAEAAAAAEAEDDIRPSDVDQPWR